MLFCLAGYCTVSAGGISAIVIVNVLFSLTGYLATLVVTGSISAIVIVYVIYKHGASSAAKVTGIVTSCIVSVETGHLEIDLDGVEVEAVRCGVKKLEEGVGILIGSDNVLKLAGFDIEACGIVCRVHLITEGELDRVSDILGANLSRIV